VGQPQTAINIEYNSRRERSLLQELSIGAWGDRRNSATWRSFTGTPPEPLFDRGFTGHEHLYAFGLINMNGRMYDPLVSRMLSPDNFIQAPDFSQGFNRYSYCYNNPLVYIDPDGEIVWAPIIIAAVIGGSFNLVMNAPNINNGWDALGYFAIGAAAGAVGGIAEQAVAGAVGTIGFAGGAMTGGAVGFSGGFITGTGNSWMGRANFEDGLVSGLNTGAIGGLTGSFIGGISGGITAARHGGKFWSDEGATFDALATHIAGDKIEIGTGMEYTNEYAQKFSDDYFDKNIKGLNDLHADGTYPIGYSSKGDNVFNRAGESVAGTTRYLGTGKGSDVYLYKAAFTSKKQLYLMMGHEYIHVAHFDKGLLNMRYSEHATLQWQKAQSKAFGIMPYNHTYTNKFMNPIYYNAKYDYEDFMINPIINFLW